MNEIRFGPIVACLKLSNDIQDKAWIVSTGKPFVLGLIYRSEIFNRISDFVPNIQCMLKSAHLVKSTNPHSDWYFVNAGKRNFFCSLLTIFIIIVRGKLLEPTFDRALGVVKT